MRLSFSPYILSPQNSVLTIQTSRGAHTRESAPRVTPNRLGASSKSNKLESEGWRCFWCLEENLAAHSSQELKLTLGSGSLPSPCLDSLKDLALGGIGEVFCKLERVLCSSEASSKWKWEWGGIYTRASKTSRYWADYTLIGTSDTPSKLPTN